MKKIKKQTITNKSNFKHSNEYNKAKMNIKEVKKIKKQTIAKKDNFKSVNGHNKAKIMVSLLFLSLVLVFSFAVSDVAAAQGTSNNTLDPSNNLTVPDAGLGDSQTTLQPTSNISTPNNNNSSNSINSGNNTTSKETSLVVNLKVLR